MNKKIQHTALLTAVLFLIVIGTACTRSMNYEEMVEYVSNPENGFAQKKTINGTSIKLTYRPTELMVAQQLNRKDSISKQEVEETYEKYSNQHYFILSLSQGGEEILSNAADRQRFSMLVNQLSFNMHENVVLTTVERDTLPLVDFHSPRYFGISSTTDILFVFEKEKRKTNELIFKLNEFGLGTGNTKFIFELSKKINRIKLDINNVRI